MEKLSIILVGFVLLSGLAVGQIVGAEEPGGRAVYEGSVPQKIVDFELSVGESFSKEFEINGVEKKVSLTLREVDSPKDCQIFVADEAGNWSCANYSVGQVVLLVETSSGSAESFRAEESFKASEALIFFDKDYSIYLEGLTGVGLLAGSLYESTDFRLLKKIVPITVSYSNTEDDEGILTGYALPDFGESGGEPESVSEEPRSESSDAVLKIGESFFDTYEINGDLKTIKTTYKDFPVSDECVSKPGFEPTGCGEFHKIVLLVEIKSANSGETETTEVVFDEYAGGKNMEQLLSENYTIVENRVYEDGAVMFSFYKKILPENALPSQTDSPNAAGETIIKQNEIEVKSKLEVEVSGQNLVVKTLSDKKTLNVSPARAVEAVQAKEKTGCQDLSLLEKNNKIVYECKTKQAGKILGLLLVEFEVTSEINAEREAEVVVSKPWWSFLVFK